MKKLTPRFLSKQMQMLALALGLAVGLSPVTASAQSTPSTSRTGVSISLPNGYATISAEDMRLMSIAGEVRWMRQWDGQEWKFQPQWESLSQSWKNLTGSQSADTTAGTVSGGSGGLTSSSSSSGSGGSGGSCWVWVDEDWQASAPTGAPSIEGVLEVGPMLAVRSLPFNRLMGEASQDYPPVQRVSVDYASLCAGSSISGGGSFRDTEGLRRINQLYLGDSGRYAFNNRSILEKRAVQQLPTAAAASLISQLASGRITLSPQTNAKGFRWIDRGGDWIDYNTQGQVVAYGERNNNTVWMLRDTAGTLRGVVDANGRVLWSLHYSGTGDQQLLTEIKDYPVSSIASDLPSRSVKYEYDAKNRLIKVIDVRGNTIQYDYDAGNRITKVTDAQGRAEQLAYSGDTVKQRTAPDGGVTDYVFDYDDTNKQFIGKITGPETAAGRRVDDFTHNRVGKLVRRTVNGRTDEEIRYDTGARAKIATNARGFVTRTTRNEFDQPVEVAYPDGGIYKRAYSALHLEMTQETDELGIKTQYQHDTRGNLLKKIEAVGTPDERTTEYTRNSLGQLTQVTRKGRTEINGTVTPDATWQLSFDAQGQISQTTDPEGNTRRYQYDRLGNLVQYTDPLGHSTRYEVDVSGNLTKVADALGQVRSYSFDANNNLTGATDARGKAIQLVYDAMNRPTQVTNRVGGQFKAQYSTQGMLTSVTNEDGRTRTAQFDNFLRITQQLDALGNTTAHSYQVADGTGAGTLGSLVYPTQVVYPSFTQQTRYDSRERPTSQTILNTNARGTEGLVSSAVYDARGQMTSDTDANGKTRFYSYNALGQLTETTDSLGNQTQAQYDARGNLIQITDAKGQINKFTFDKNNRLIAETLPLGQSTQYQYDAAGNLIQKTDPTGKKSIISFDVLNRVTEVKQYNNTNQLQRTSTYTWDASDNLTAWTDTDFSRPAGQQTSSATLSYDDASRKTSEVVSYPKPPTAGASGSGGTYTQGYSYQYSAAGYKTQLTWADGTQIGYSYSQHGELENVSIPGEGSISVGQFKWTAPAKVTLPGGTVQERTLDGLLNLEALKVNTPGAQTVLRIDNTYGKLQELKTNNRTDSAPTSASSGSSTKNSSFTYDDETRLTQATTDTGSLFGTATENFTLDAVGNRIAHSQVAGTWTYDANNRLTQRGAGTCTTNGVTCYSWDDTGNLTQKRETAAGFTQVTQYRYDTQNRLVEVTDATTGQNKLVARYGYDPLDRRLWKEQYRDKAGALLSQAKRTYYLYADEGLIAEATQDITLGAGDVVTASNTTAPTITTQYGPTPDSEFGTDVLFIKTKSSTGQDIVAYYHRDQLGTPVQATDKAGNVVWSASYNVFGQASVTTPTPGSTNGVPNYGTITSNIRLPGQYLDDETGLHYNYRRYYDTQSGRYVTQDPIGVEGGINQYSYVGATPYEEPTLRDCGLG